jgi:hypothetical protein
MSSPSLALSRWEIPRKQKICRRYRLLSQLAYLFQEGVAEYNSQTDYYINSFVKYNGAIYYSKTDNNMDNPVLLADGGLNSNYWGELLSPQTILEKLLTVDGAGSALDADKLDGQEGAYYQNAGTLPAARLPSSPSFDTVSGTLARFTDMQAGDGSSNHGIQIGDDAKFIDVGAANTTRLAGAQDPNNSHLQVMRSGAAKELVAHGDSPSFDTINVDKGASLRL